MCTYYRPIRTGNIVEFIFEYDSNKNKYILIRPSDIIFDFTIHNKFITFDIDTHKFEKQGYGSALMSIIFEYAQNGNFDFICGKLSTVDYTNGNWERSIPFYLHQRDNAFLIKENAYMRNIYNNNFDKFIEKYTRYYSFKDFTISIKDGYIIYPLVNFQNIE